MGIESKSTYVTRAILIIFECFSLDSRNTSKRQGGRKSIDVFVDEKKNALVRTGLKTS